MSKLNICQQIYPILLIKSIGKKSFQAMSTIVNKSGSTIKRWLYPADNSFEQMVIIANQLFANKKKLYLAIDDTLIKKAYSKQMVGSGWFYESKIGKKILAYKVLCAAIGDGRYLIPTNTSFLFDKDLLGSAIQSKDEIVKSVISNTLSMFRDKEIIVVMDGAFATKKLLRWALDNKIAVEVRMHSNRKVQFKGKSVVIRDIKKLNPKGRHFARTVTVSWHGILLDITGCRRIDKHGNESIVYQAATYRTKPSEHVKAYKARWSIEKCFRTCKQHLGLQDCYSTKMDVQFNHVASVFYSYAIVQLEMKKRRFNTPEETIRTFKRKNVSFLIRTISPPDQIFGNAHA